MPTERDTHAAIACADLSLAWTGSGRPAGARVVEGVTFTLARGGALSVSGPTGSGKSSLLAMLSGRADYALHVDGGDAIVEGISVRRPGKAKRMLVAYTGYLAQGAGAHLDARMTVGDIIAEPITSRDRKVNARALAVRTAALLDEVELPLGAAGKFPYELSAGMLQRVALARSLVLEPRILLADDPLANLDIEVRHVVRDAILRRRLEHGMAAVIATNDTELPTELDAARIVLRQGHVVAQDGPDGELIWTPGSGPDHRVVAS
ncbi:MAG: ATP-binding cassette domain-containing protein [Microbacterium sp.]|uniref:ATP-binding cassette domain-containing protein n=1 Tax=Microbacterium sp. TaxID=51671 RepID=UPI0039E69A8C